MDHPFVDIASVQIAETSPYARIEAPRHNYLGLIRYTHMCLDALAGTTSYAIFGLRNAGQEVLLGGAYDPSGEYYPYLSLDVLVTSDWVPFVRLNDVPTEGLTLYVYGIAYLP